MFICVCILEYSDSKFAKVSGMYTNTSEIRIYKNSKLVQYTLYYNRFIRLLNFTNSTAKIES